MIAAIRVAGSDGLPTPGGANRSAYPASGNTSARCAAKNANMLPAGTRCPASASASAGCLSIRSKPCMR